MSLHVLYIPEYRTPLRGKLLEFYGQISTVGVIIVLVPDVSNDIIIIHEDERRGSEGGQSLSEAQLWDRRLTRARS